MQLGVHVTAGEAELIRRAVELRGARSVSAWAREILRRAAHAVVESAPPEAAAGRRPVRGEQPPKKAPGAERR